MPGVVHVSEAVNLGIHTMVMIASAPERPLRVVQAADVLGVSENHLAKVLQRLARAGLVASTRGPRGGFTLDRPAGQVTLLQIYEALEGPLPESGCLLGKPRCGGTCALGGFVHETTERFRKHLAKTRLSELAGAIPRRDD